MERYGRFADSGGTADDGHAVPRHAVTEGRQGTGAIDEKAGIRELPRDGRCDLALMQMNVAEDVPRLDDRPGDRSAQFIDVSTLGSGSSGMSAHRLD